MAAEEEFKAANNKATREAMAGSKAVYDETFNKRSEKLHADIDAKQLARQKERERLEAERRERMRNS